MDIFRGIGHRVGEANALINDPSAQASPHASFGSAR
jgi:hypothetical protein